MWPRLYERRHLGRDHGERCAVATHAQMTNNHLACMLFAGYGGAGVYGGNARLRRQRQLPSTRKTQTADV
jgi:hypothetical protein